MNQGKHASFYWLDTVELTPATLQRCGRKAGTLAALYQAGFPVPLGFVVPQPAESEQVVADPAWSLTITAALKQLSPQGTPVAVRSSASEEDQDQQTFAGQFQSYLNVLHLDVIERIQVVWRSRAATHVQSYRQQTQVHLEAPSLEPQIAALVQPMITATAAGAAFAADPVSGQRHVAVINAVTGLADQLVSGEVTGDAYTVSQAGQILTKQLAEGRDAPVLTDSQILQVAQLVRQVSDFLGRPQDIEWAFAAEPEAGQTLYLLQARPITGLAAIADPEGAWRLWDNSNIVESYCGVTTPLTFSFARKAYAEVYRQFCRFMGIPEIAIARQRNTFNTMIGCLRGRIYYNLLNWYRILTLLPGTRLNAKFMEQMMGVGQGIPADVLATLQAENRVSVWQDALRLGATLTRGAWNFCTLDRWIDRYENRLAKVLWATPAQFKQWRADQLVQYYRQVEGELLTHWDAPIINDFFAMIFYGLLRRWCQSWCGDSTGNLQNSLLALQGEVISAEPIQRLQTMAAIARQQPDLVSVLCTGSRREIDAAVAQVPELQQPLADYLDQFGDRCLQELKLESPTLQDDPLPVLRTLGHMASQLDLDQGHRSPIQDQAQAAKQAAERNCLHALRRSPLKTWLFRWVLANARRLLRNRENLRFERTRVFGQARRIFLELGRRYYALDLLHDPHDIFYLEVEEALSLVEGTCTCTNLAGLVAVRRAEYQHNQALAAPANRCETRGIPYKGNTLQDTQRSLQSDCPSAVQTAESKSIWQGIGCAPGQVAGSVQVVTDPHTWLSQQQTQTSPIAASSSKPILVAASTDPGWVLLFPHAQGLIVERGSVLSHVAIVARELGLPMVSGLPGIAQMLQTGDRVRLDGKAGSVQRLGPLVATISQPESMPMAVDTITARDAIPGVAAGAE